jgi:hypothetical protein
MAVSFENLHRKKMDKPPRILISGRPKIGKTTLASEFPNPVFLQTEDGENEVEISTFGEINSYEEYYNLLADLYHKDHDFKTVVTDTATALEKLIFDKVVRDNPTTEKGKPVKSIEDYGYGKGYILAEHYWRELMEGWQALRRDRGMFIVLLAHETVETHRPPDGEPFNRYSIALNSRAREYLIGEFDVILHLSTPRHVKETEDARGRDHKYATGSSQVIMNADNGSPSNVGGSRITMPATIRFERGKGYEALAPFFPPFATETAQKDAA